MDKSENNAPHTNNSRLSKINRELLVFLIFLFIAIAFWFIQTFKDSMSMSIDYQLKITGIPKSVITTSQIPETVNVRVYGRGFQLLRLLFSSQERVVEVDYSSMKDNNKALLIDNEIWKRAFDRILPSGISINERSLQTLEIFYSDGKHKAVKVLFDGKISTKSDFILCYFLYYACRKSSYVFSTFILDLPCFILLSCLTFISTSYISFNFKMFSLLCPITLLLSIGLTKTCASLTFTFNFLIFDTIASYHKADSTSCLKAG